MHIYHNNVINKLIIHHNDYDDKAITLDRVMADKC